MAAMYDDPRNLSRFGGTGTPNPFYTIANQFVPRNLHDVIKWARFIFTQSPTLTEVIRKYATYPITEIEYTGGAGSNLTEANKYKALEESLKLPKFLADSGVNFYTIGNDFISIYFPIIRTLVCPDKSCNHAMEIRAALRSGDYKFHNFKFRGTCTKCLKASADFKVVDVKSMDVSGINLIRWPAETITINHNHITGESEYWYNIPNSVKRRVMAGDPNFISTIPWEIIEAVKKKQSFLFSPGSLYQMKNLEFGGILEGYGLPPIISMYSSVFHIAILKRANEAIATEHMTPLRVIYPNQGSSAGDPISMMSMQGFVGRMEDSFKKFRTDPNHLIVAPIPVGYQAIGGQGRAMLVTQELEAEEESMLLGMGVSRELLSGSTNWTSSTIGLRLLENTMSSWTSEMDLFIQWTMTKIGAYLGYSPVKAKLKPFALIDDETLKNQAVQLAEAGLISPSKLMSVFDMDLKEELETSVKDKVAMALRDAEVNDKVKTALFMKSQELEEKDKESSGITEVRKKAYELAVNIANRPDPIERAQLLFSLKAESVALYTQVQELLDEYTVMVQSQAQGVPMGGLAAGDGQTTGVEPVNDVAASGNNINPSRLAGQAQA
jgi:hypothetical protein